jgi:hypothetical protein
MKTLIEVGNDEQSSAQVLNEQNNPAFGLLVNWVNNVISAPSWNSRDSKREEFKNVPGLNYDIILRLDTYFAPRKVAVHGGLMPGKVWVVEVVKK